ncbi:RNA-binding protein 28 [Histomonas meleagridis]|uniref:RNA-binding protein 28 n=1 Tax=Histomonas meleagridis TaxID=135588 RepID=UPI00355A9DB4|nr:RNA-binding protein 28 [Histomonas meleagridis]KAH0801822.1 RNA-binding protein 28 [Histomonas meleagridis]
MFKTFEQFGEITRICFVAKQNNPHTGSAFVDYATEESGQAVLEKSNSKIESILVKDQNVLVIMAASRDEILEKMKPKDKRNIHLMYEGHITPDMEAAEGVPEAEMAKRKKLWERKQAKLADDNNKISPTRLAIFNAPPSASTLQIRKIFAVAPKKYARTHKNEELSKLIKQSSPKITDIRKVEGQEGVFFLEFTKHEHALGALRMVNNNPSYFPGRRLIVEFAIVNSFKTKARNEKQTLKKKLREERFERNEPPSKMIFDSDDDFE